MTSPAVPPSFPALPLSRLIATAAVTLAIGYSTFGAPASSTAPASVGPAGTQPLAHEIGENPDPSRYLFEDQLRPGMKGYGLTVMHGGTIEKFDVEIIDVVRNFSPGNNAILVRCSGLGLEHSGIIAGMSGSPVFMEGKMIGAVAYGWGLSKDPIGGVQPIRQMLAIRAAADAAKKEVQAAGGSIRWGTDSFFARTAAGAPGWKRLAKSLGRTSKAVPVAAAPRNGLPTGMIPLMSPLMVSGGSPSTLAALQESLAGTNLMPVASGSAGSTPDLSTTNQELGGLGQVKVGAIRLEPGSAIALPLVTGDMDLSAIGTVTEVRDKKVFAFGHAFMGEGGTRLPMATSYIYTVLPNLSVSFKMGTSITATGTLVTDEETGIVGLQGAVPPTVPITFAVKHDDGTVDNTYHYQLAPHPHLTPELLTAIVGESLIAHRALPHEFTAHLTGTLKFDSSFGPRTIAIDTLGAAPLFNPNIAMLPVAILGDNPFEDMKLREVKLDATIDNTNRSAEIASITLNRLTAAPGDEVTATVRVNPFKQEPVFVPVTVKIPADVPDGDYALSVGSSSMALSEETGYAPQRFDPHDIQSLADAVQHLLDYKNSRLYATLVLNVSGAAANGHERHDLPASRLALYASDRRSDTTPIYDVVQAQVPTAYVIEQGGQSFQIHVDRNADHRYYEPASNSNHGGGNGNGPASHVSMPEPSGPQEPPQDPDN